jgi:hypothetical protein
VTGCRARDHQVRFQEPIAHTRRFEVVVGQDLEWKVEAPEQLVPPLLSQAAGADDQAPLEVASCDEFLNEEARHDRFAAAGSSARRNRSCRGSMVS